MKLHEALLALPGTDGFITRSSWNGSGPKVRAVPSNQFPGIEAQYDNPEWDRSADVDADDWEVVIESP